MFPHNLVTFYFSSVFFVGFYWTHNISLIARNIVGSTDQALYNMVPTIHFIILVAFLSIRLLSSENGAIFFLRNQGLSGDVVHVELFLA